MKINKEGLNRRSNRLSAIKAGTPVSFCKQFHQDHCIEDPFIIVNHNGYLDSQPDMYYKIVVVNLKTGKMSIVDKTRDVFIIKGEFTILRGCNDV